MIIYLQATQFWLFNNSQQVSDLVTLKFVYEIYFCFIYIGLRIMSNYFVRNI